MLGEKFSEAGPPNKINFSITKWLVFSLVRWLEIGSDGSSARGVCRRFKIGPRKSLMLSDSRLRVSWVSKWVWRDD